MRRRIQLQILVVMLSLASMWLGAVPVVGAETMRAELDGHPIALHDVGKWNCHDLDHPVIRCYRTEAALNKALANHGIGPLALVASGISYVRVWEDATFSGATAVFSINYASLGSIGWNDKITSLIAINSQHGEFYEHNTYGGLVYSFCCNVQVPNVGSTYNDLFSSVRNLT